MASTVWGFDEQRDEQVTFPGSALVPMHESRIQQAHHGAYRLGELFSELCAADLVGAVMIFCDLAANGDMTSSTTPTPQQDWPLITPTATGWLDHDHDLDFSKADSTATKMAEPIAVQLARQAHAG